MSVENKELICHEYVHAVKDLNQFGRRGLYRADALRVNLHNILCKMFGLSKTQTLQYTDNLDKLSWSGAELYLSLLDESRKTKTRPEETGERKDFKL